MFREIEQTDTNHYAFWKNKIRKRTAGVVAAGLAVLSISGIGCKIIQSPNPIETPPNPAVSEPPTGISIEAACDYKTRESIKNGTEPIYNQLIDDIVTGVDRNNRYFVTIGEKEDKCGRMIIFTEPIELQRGNPNEKVRHEKVWVAIGEDGPKIFSIGDVSSSPLGTTLLSSDLIEKFISSSLDDLRQGTKDRLDYDRGRLFREKDTGKRVGMHISPKGSGDHFVIIFKPYSPANAMIEEAIRKSQKKAGLPSKPESGIKDEEALQDAKRTSEALAPLIKP